MRPDIILHHGKITTLDRQRPDVSALAIENGRIAAVGDNDTVLSVNELLDTGRISDLPATKLVDEPTGDVYQFVQH